MKRTSIILIALAAPGAFAEPDADPGQEKDRWALCAPVVDTRAAELPPLTELAPGATQVSADEAVAEADSVTRLSGHVAVQRETAMLLGDRAQYDKRNDRLLMQGNVSYRNQGVMIDGEQAELMLNDERGSFSGATFFFPSSHGFGEAERITISDAEHAALEGLSYTTCPPESVDWQLKASELKLNQETNTGEAWHARLSFKGVPFFYSPYLNFPLEGRKSGLLPPTFGSSEENGTDISLPIYWNIAPNQDATFTPRNITKRGTMLMGEYRLLTENSNGQINGSYLGDDKLYDDDRSYFSLRHNARFSKGWRSSLVYRRSSDSDFFLDDLAGNEESGSQTHLERRADMRYSDRYWNFLARVQDYQTLSGTSPYQRLPQLRLNGEMPERTNRLRFALESEAVSFRHDTRIPTGDRLDLKPSVSLPMGGAAWFVTPTLAARHTRYQLQDYSIGDSFERTLPISTLDSGLFFDRSLQLGDAAYTQTLEPRLFYLRVPYEDQDELPRFDTGERDFSFSQMFSDNRFSGADRQGDADQLTFALTSRLLDEQSGREKLRGSIGQIHYFRDREVTLDSGDPVATRERSDIIGEIAFSPDKTLSTSLTEQWNPEEEQVERLNARLRYTPGYRKVLNMGYRYHREDNLHQADVAAFWPVARQWRVLGRYQYDLENELSLDAIGGLEYESCCWSIRVLARAQRDNIDEGLNRSIYFTLELKGLASLGRGLEDSVERGILGN